MLSTFVAINLSVLHDEFSSVSRGTMAVKEKACQAKTSTSSVINPEASND